jgi:hypothetical protein
MKLPPLTAHHALGPPSGPYATGRPTLPAPGVRPMTTLACLTRCVGDQAARGCARCGPDLACWAKCTGVSDTRPIAACLAS